MQQKISVTSVLTNKGETMERKTKQKTLRKNTQKTNMRRKKMTWSHSYFCLFNMTLNIYKNKKGTVKFVLSVKCAKIIAN